MPTIERKFTDRAELIDSLYQAFVGELQQALTQHSSASILLSGGSSPAPLYRRLASADMDWEQIHIALVDERWVETDNAASNERLLRENLLIDKAANAVFQGMKTAHHNPFDGAAECNARYAALPLPAALCLLGMGPDGHTASLFPNARGLDAALDSSQHCAAISAVKSDVTGDYLERMTLTPWSILQSRRLILLITGEDKWEVYARARDAGATAEQPISLFIHQDKVPLEVYWGP